MFRNLLRIKPHGSLSKTTLSLPSNQTTHAITLKPASPIRPLHTTPKFSAFKKEIAKFKTENATKKPEPLQSSLLIPALLVGTGIAVGAGVVLSRAGGLYADAMGLSRPKTWAEWWENKAEKAKERTEFLKDTSPIVRELYDLSNAAHQKKYISDMPAESLRTSIVTLRDLTQALHILDTFNRNSLLEKLGSNYLQNLIKPELDLDKLIGSADLSSCSDPTNYYYILALARPDKFVKLLQNETEFNRLFCNGSTTDFQTRLQILQSLTDEDLHKVINNPQKLCTVLDNLSVKNTVEEGKLLSRFNKDFSDQWTTYCEHKEESSSSNRRRM